MLVQDLIPETFLEGSVGQTPIKNLSAVGGVVRVIVGEGPVAQCLFLIEIEGWVSPEKFQDGVLLLWGKFDSDLFFFYHDLVVHDPVLDLAQMFLTRSELKGLLDAETSQFHSFLVFLSFLEEELGRFFVEAGDGLRGQIRILGHRKGTKERVDQVLVRLIE